MEQKIRELAYEIWEKAGRPESDGVQYWLQAESELVPCRRDLFEIEFSPQKRLNRQSAAKVSPRKR